MKKIFMLLSALLLIIPSCHQDKMEMDILTEKESMMRIRLPKISRDATSISPEEAAKVANLYLSSSSTKSNETYNVKEVISIRGDSGEIAMYAVNYDDGYLIISASKKFYPVLAEIPHGNYNDTFLSKGMGIFIADYQQCIKNAANGNLSFDSTGWSIYEETERPELMTRSEDAYYDVFDRYYAQWTSQGYSVYLLRNKPDEMPEDLYESYCSMAETYDRTDYGYMNYSVIIERISEEKHSYGPYCQTKWHQEVPFWPTDADKLGCTTIAAGQIMRYFEFPTSFDWDNMPNDTSNETLRDFLTKLRNRIG